VLLTACILHFSSGVSRFITFRNEDKLNISAGHNDRICMVLHGAPVPPQCALANALNAGSEVLTGVCFYVLGQVVTYLDYFAVKTKALSSFATSVTLYHPTRCNILEDFNFKSFNVSAFVQQITKFLVLMIVQGLLPPS
jgi:hypothetical protein